MFSVLLDQTSIVAWCEQLQKINNKVEQYTASTSSPNSLNENPNPWSNISDIAPYVAIVMLQNLKLKTVWKL